MGGQVFSTAGSNGEPPLHVPRLSTEQYKAIAEKYYKILLEIYEHVLIPRTILSKQDHGDVDYLVCSPRCSVDSATLQSRLDAARAVDNGTISLAVPLTIPRADHTEDTVQSFAQIDIHLCHSYASLLWTHSLKSYGDLWQILGKQNRALNLVANEQGLHLRLPDLEETYGKKKGLLFLTADPDQAIDFLGLDADKFHTGFETETDAFDWVANGRYFAPADFRKDHLRSSDRQRLAKRQMYRRFVDEYIGTYQALDSKCPAADASDLQRPGPDSETETEKETKHTESHPPKQLKPETTQHQSPNRAHVLEDVLQSFAVRDAHNAMTKQHRVFVFERDFWAEVATGLPALGKSYQRQSLTLLKNIFLTDGTHFVVDSRGNELGPRVGERTFEEVCEQVKARRSAGFEPLLSRQDALGMIWTAWPKEFGARGVEDGSEEGLKDGLGEDEKRRLLNLWKEHWEEEEG